MTEETTNENEQEQRRKIVALQTGAPGIFMTWEGLAVLYQGMCQYCVHGCTAFPLMIRCPMWLKISFAHGQLVEQRLATRRDRCAPVLQVGGAVGDILLDQEIGVGVRLLDCAVFGL